MHRFLGASSNSSQAQQSRARVSPVQVQMVAMTVPRPSCEHKQSHCLDWPLDMRVELSKRPVRLLIVGCPGVGKATLAECVLRGRGMDREGCNTTKPTSSCVITDVHLEREGWTHNWGASADPETIPVRVYLTVPGQESIPVIGSRQDGVILLYDVTDAESRKYVLQLKNELIVKEVMVNQPYFLVGNKEDYLEGTKSMINLEKQIKIECKANGIDKFYELSAKTGKNVQQTMKDIVLRTITARQANSAPPQDSHKPRKLPRDY